MDYLLWGLFSVGAVLVWSHVNKALFGDLLSPFNLLLFGWIGPLLLRGFNLSELERPWTTEILLIILCVTLGLVFPLIAMQPLIRSRRLSAKRAVFEKTAALFRDRRFIGLMVACFVVSFGAYVYTEFVTNPVGIPLITLIQNPLIPREAFNRWGRSGGSSFVGLMAIPVFVLTPMLYLAFRASRRRYGRIFLLVLALLFPIGALLKLSRIDAIQTIISFILIEYYYRKFLPSPRGPNRFGIVRLSKWAVVTAGLIVGGTLLNNVFLEIRGGVANSLELGQSLGYKFEPNAPPLFSELAGTVYGYFAMPVENFANFYKANPNVEFNVGIGVFRPFYSLTGQGRLADSMLERIDLLDNLRLWPVNTYPFITLSYAELGLPGLLLSPVLYSAMVSIFYLGFRRRPTFIRFFLYLMCPYGWLWLFSSAGFTVLTFYIYLAFVVGFYVLYSWIVLCQTSEPGALEVNSLP